MSFKWMKNVREVTPYVPGEQPQQGRVIKLNTNENPYPPAPEVARLVKEMDTDKYRLYPDPEVTELCGVLADYYEVKPENVFVGVGSDDVLAMSFLTFFNSEKPVLFPNITYSFYEVWADLFKIPYIMQALDTDFRIKTEDYQVPNGGIVIANPNAPTSIAMPLCEIEKIVSANEESVVIIDEAYIDFGGESALSLVNKYDNLLVVRTFSKSRSMAGMRIGFAIGNEELIKALNAVKGSYNSYTMNMPSIILGSESVKDDAYFKETIGKIVATRERTIAAMKKMGFSILESSTNFIFATHEAVPAKKIFDELRNQNIYVRYFNKPLIDNYLRISIGTDEEMAAFLEKLASILK